jgi:hypothetical protein
MSRPIPVLVPSTEVVDYPVEALPPLATPEQYLAIVGQPPPEGLLDQASAAVRSYCGWHISPVLQQAMALDGSGGQTVGLPTLRLLDVLEVLDAGATDLSDPDTVPMDPADYDWSADGRLVNLMGAWSSRPRAIRATVVHGYAPEEVPDVSGLVIITAARAAGNPAGVRSVSTGSQTVTYAAQANGETGGVSLFADQQASLDLYRIRDPS